MPYIELLQENNKTNILSSHFKGCGDINLDLLYEHYHQIILDTIKAREKHNHDEYMEDGYYYNVDSDDYDDNDNQELLFHI